VLLLRISLTLFLFASFLFAEVKIFATDAKETNNTLILKNPVIIYNNSIIQADKGFVTQKRKIILNGHVFISYKNKSVVSANSLTAYSSQNIDINDVFFYDREMNGWIIADKSKSLESKIKFKKLYFSTCCVKKPDWFMKASSATFDRKAKNLKLYNITLVINKIPVFYLPYLYLNFDKTRRSGLLHPYLGYSQNEGLLYSQPIYFATSVNTDLEITPTIRTLRGKGVYTVFRFVDSPTSSGYLKTGVFTDKYDYYIKNNLANHQHYGFIFNYKKNKLFKDKDKLYMYLKYANDVDYFYLDAYNYKFDDTYLSDKLITSELNYLIPEESNLYGAYLKYFIDTTKLTNDLTWQILPQLNFHHYLNKKYGVLNSLDLNVYNYYRKTGSNFVLSDLLLPLSLNYSLFSDYLKFKITESLNAGYGYYYQIESLKSTYLNISTQIKIYNSLTKVNTHFIHIVSPSLIINLKNISNSRIYTDLMNVPDIQNYVSLNLFQILQVDEFKLTHTLNETYYLDLEKYADFENILNMQYNNIAVDENNRYSIEKNQVSYNNIKISYNKNPFSCFLSHVYQRDVSRSYTVGMIYNVNNYKKVYSEYNFDLNNHYTKYWLMGVKLDKKCWRYDFSFKQSRIPILEESGISYKKDNMVTLNIILKPIGGLNQTFVFKGQE
jgi:LPS-assembly protein